MSNPLDQLWLLHGMSENVIQAFNQYARRKNFKTGEAIIWQGDPCEAVFFVLSGEVEIYRLSSGGREQILDRTPTGGCFNLIPALLESGANQANVRTLTDCELLAIAKPDFQKLLVDFPKFTLSVTRFFAERLAHMADLIETLSLYSVRQKLARFLMDQADKVRKEKATRWTQTDIARRLGTVREVLGRALRKLEEEGIVQIDREKILLLDREKLERASFGDE